MQHQPTGSTQLSLIGTLIGDRWLVNGELGAGGMGTVYSAIHTHNARRVAIKVLNPAIAHNPEVRERFYQEAYAANLVVHPGTVAALDDGCLDDGTPYLVMELLSGHDLEQLLNEVGPLDERYVVSLSIELLSILEAAHDAGVLHRDIKPENIFCTTDGKVKLLDFGIAKVSESKRTHHTQCGSTIGTPAYMPPEQARGKWEELDARSDLWSVGATMFALLSGHLVHRGSTVNELLLSAMTQPPVALQSVAPHISSAIASVVDRALTFEQDGRYSSASEMRSALISALDHCGQITEFPPLSASPRARSESSNPRTTHRPVMTSDTELAPLRLHSKRGWGIAASMAALCVGSLAVFYLADGGTSERKIVGAASVSSNAETVSNSPETERPLVVEVPGLSTEEVRAISTAQPITATTQDANEMVEVDPSVSMQRIAGDKKQVRNQSKAKVRKASYAAASIVSLPPKASDSVPVEANFDPLAQRR